MRYSKCSFCTTVHTGNDIPTNCVCCGAPLPMPEYTKNDDELKDFRQAAMEGAAEAVKKVMDKALLGDKKNEGEKESEEFEGERLALIEILDDIEFNVNVECRDALKPIVRKFNAKYNPRLNILITAMILIIGAATVLAWLRWEMAALLVTAGLIIICGVAFAAILEALNKKFEACEDELTEIAEQAFNEALNGEYVRELYKKADDNYFNWKPEENGEKWRRICDERRDRHNGLLDDIVKTNVNHALYMPLDWQGALSDFAILPITLFCIAAVLGLVGLAFNANPTTTTKDSFTAINHICSLQSSICLEDGEGNKLYLGLAETEKENQTAQAVLEEIKKLSEDDTITVETKTVKYGFKDRFMKSGEPSEWNKTHYYINGAEFEIYLNQTACRQLDSYSDEYVFTSEAAAEATTETIVEATT